MHVRVVPFSPELTLRQNERKTTLILGSDLACAVAFCYSWAMFGTPATRQPIPQSSSYSVVGATPLLLVLLMICPHVVYRFRAG